MKLSSLIVAAGALLLSGAPALAQQSPLDENTAAPHQSVKSTPRYHELPPLREQARMQDEWLAERKEGIPKMLQKHNVDAWLISQREYGEETVFFSLKAGKQFFARRRTTFLFFANESAPAYSWIDNTPTLWTDLVSALEKHQPASIAIDVHQDIAFSSGLHAGELDAITAGIGPHWSGRFVTRPMLAVEYIGTQIEARLGWYRKMQETAWAIIAEAFSEKVINPGKTTTEDVEWWMREKIQALNYTTWFHPSVEIVTETDFFASSSSSTSTSVVAPTINYGDYLHCDFGVTAMGMNTDTQHLAYVLYPGQTSHDDVPSGLREGLKKVNRLQDIARANMKPGMKGNDILKASLAQMRDEGIGGKIYSHPIGDWGHSAGTLVGMTNLQDRVPVLGDLPLIANTWYSVELYAENYVDADGGMLDSENSKGEGQLLNFYQEEDVYWKADESKEGGGSFEWVYGQQQEFLLIKTPKSKDGASGQEWMQEDL